MKSTALIVIIVLSFILASCKAKHTKTKPASNFNSKPVPDNSSKPTGYNSTKPANNGKYIKVIINNSSYAALKDDGTVISCYSSNNCNNPKNVKNLKEVSNIYAAGATFAAIYGKNKKLFLWTNPEHGQTITVNSKPLLNVHALTSSKSQNGSSVAAAIYGANNQVFMWGTVTSAVVVNYKHSPIAHVKSLTASNGIFVGTYDNDNKVFIWDINNNAEKIITEEKVPVTAVKSIYAIDGIFAFICGKNDNMLTSNWHYGDDYSYGKKVMVNKKNNTILTNVKSISTKGKSFAAIYGNDEKVFIWKNDTFVGYTINNAGTPLTKVKSISVTGNDFAAIYGDKNKIFAGSFSVGSTVMLNKTDKTPLTNVSSIFSTEAAFAAIYDNDNKVFIFGNSENGGVFNGKSGTIFTSNNTPLTNVKSIFKTHHAFAAIYDNNKKVFIWGNSGFGGTFNTKSGTILTSNNTPLTNVTSIFATYDDFAAIYNNQKNILIWGAGGIHDIKPYEKQQ